MGGVFRQRGVSKRGNAPGVQPGLILIGLALALLAGACGADSALPPVSVPNSEVVPESLDGLWILENTDLNLDIATETAEVDARTSCARLLGSLTFVDNGTITSFSLPGRDDRSCSPSELAEVDELSALLEQVVTAEAEEGGYRLLDTDDELLGRLRIGS